MEQPTNISNNEQKQNSPKSDTTDKNNTPKDSGDDKINTDNTQQDNDQRNTDQVTMCHWMFLWIAEWHVSKNEVAFTFLVDMFTQSNTTEKQNTSRDREDDEMNTDHTEQDKNQPRTDQVTLYDRIFF